MSLRLPVLLLGLLGMLAACDPSVESAIDASSTDGMLGPQPGTGPEHVRYRGQLASTPTATFGGGTYCTYEVALVNVVIEVVLHGTEELTSMTLEDSVKETIVGTCPYAPQPQTRQSFVHGGGPVPAGGDGSFRPLLVGLTTNRPMTETTSLVTQVGDGTLQATARWERTDQGPPLNWVVMTASPVPLEPASCEIGGLVCVGGSSEGVLYACEDGLQMSLVRRCAAGCAASQDACN